jgi:hypothetical protein
MAILTGVVRPEDMSTAEAQTILDSRKGNLYFDYLNGRMIKVNLGQDNLDLRLYDRDNGPGAGMMVILDEFTRPFNG